MQPANFIYPYAKALFIGCNPDYQLNWVRDTFSLVLCNDKFVPNQLLKFVADIHPEDTFICEPQEMKGKSVSQYGACSAPLIMRDITAGKNIAYVLIYHDTGDPSTSELVVCQSLSSTFPLLSDGKPFTVRWKNGIITP